MLEKKMTPNLRSLITLGGITINLYGLLFLAAILIILLILRRYMQRHNHNPELAIGGTLYAMAGVIIGARLVYSLYYSFPSFVQNPLSIFYIWQGGMSFHGGMLGLLLAGYWFCRKHKLPFLVLADTLVIPAAILLGAGRIINFLDHEITGTLTNILWCVEFQEIAGCRHPVQLYDALNNFFLAGVMYAFRKRKQAPGTLLFSYILFYSIIRFSIDFFRVYEFTLFGLGAGQYLALMTTLIAGYGLYRVSHAR